LPGAEVAPDHVVLIVVARAVMLELPNVIGRQSSDAQAALKSFNVGTDTIESDRPKGEVVGQTPEADTDAPVGTKVVLRVSDGSIVYMPQLHGMTLARARAELQRVGDLRAVVAQPGSETSIVDTSMPGVGASLKRGSTIALTLVPPRPWRLWAMGAVALLAVGGVGLNRLYRLAWG
jgi:serine/threonine-protein kinase